jgi:uncharacterized protein with von Willebrand factor type A (vWA) domain
VGKLRETWKSRFTRLLQRARQTPELSNSTVRHDKLDDGVLGDMLERALHFKRGRDESPSIDLDKIEDDEGEFVKLTDRQKEKIQEYVAWGDLYDDLFRALHTYHEPEILPPEKVKVSRELNRRIMDAVVNDPNFPKLRPSTRHSDIDAAFATIAMADELGRLMETQLRDFVLRIKDLEETENQMSKGGGGRPGESEEDRLERLAQELAERDDQQQQQALGLAVHEAIKKAVEDGKEAADVIGQLPGRDPGMDARMNPDEMIELAERWRKNEDLRRVAMMAGRLRRDMYQKRARRVRGGLEEMVDVKLGNDIGLLLPHEMSLLKHPLLKRDFQRRYHEHSLLEFETEGLDTAGRGPLVICVDGSGSMFGERNEWARAVSLALLTIARREKRDAAVVEFSSPGQTASWEFLRREGVKPERILDFITHIFEGGTHIYSGLEVSRTFIDSRPEFKQADIVLITDGGDRFEELDAEIRAHFREKGVRVHGVSIGISAEDNTYLQKMCDTVVDTDNLEGANEATDHLAQVIT